MVKKDKQSHEIRMIMIMTIANFLVLLDELVVFVAVVVGMQLPIYNWDYTGAWLCSYKLLLYSQQNENVDQEECVVFFHLEDRGFSWFNQFNQQTHEDKDTYIHYTT